MVSGQSMRFSGAGRERSSIERPPGRGRSEPSEMGGGRKAQKGGDICVHIDDSHICTRGTNITL